MTKRKKRVDNRGTHKILDDIMVYDGEVMTYDGNVVWYSDDDQAVAQQPESKPLFQKQWAVIFEVSRSTIARWIKDGKKYHFINKSKRKWALPLSELPAEYLVKFKK